MTTAIDANLNNVNCLVTKNHFGYDTIINICTGKAQDIAWTFGDWAGMVALGFLSILLATAVAFLIFLVVNAIREW